MIMKTARPASSVGPSVETSNTTRIMSSVITTGEKDSSIINTKHFYLFISVFDDIIPSKKPFTCPICEKPARDKITQIR